MPSPSVTRAAASATCARSGQADESSEAEQTLQASAEALPGPEIQKTAAPPAPEIPIREGPEVPKKAPAGENPELVPEAPEKVPEKAPSPSDSDPNVAEISRLKAMIEKLLPLAQRYAEHNPQEQIDREVARAASHESKAPPPAEKDDDEPACQDEDGNVVGHEAARQRLRRMCTPKTNGRLLVPKEVREKYVTGGAEREKLLTLLIKAKFNKECLGPIVLASKTHADAL